MNHRITKLSRLGCIKRKKRFRITFVTIIYTVRLIQGILWSGENVDIWCKDIKFDLNLDFVQVYFFSFGYRIFDEYRLPILELNLYDVFCLIHISGYLPNIKSVFGIHSVEK